MPPKRKALAEDANKGNAAVTDRKAKASKTSSKNSATDASAPKTPTKPKGHAYKYCNANTVSSQLLSSCARSFATIAVEMCFNLSQTMADIFSSSRRSLNT